MTKNLKIKIKSINNDISIPSYETSSSAGLDLRAYLPEGNIKDTIIKPERRHIETVSIGYLSNTKKPIAIIPIIIIVKEIKLSSNIASL